MRKRMGRIRLVGKNRYELYLSFVIVGVGFCQSSVLPHGYEDRLLAAGSFVLGFVCALNAVLDSARMNAFERIIGISWCAVLFFITPVVIWKTAHIEVFSPR
jgi:hypothetical protein